MSVVEINRFAANGRHDGGEINVKARRKFMMIRRGRTLKHNRGRRVSNIPTFVITFDCRQARPAANYFAEGFGTKTGSWAQSGDARCGTR